jgi:serine/threonine protein phosphatase PrpC
MVPDMIQAPAGMQIIGAMRTDTGLVRTLNEDSVAWVTPRDDDVSHTRGSLALVADGMGGHAAGEVASALAADVIRRLYYDLDGAIPQVLSKAFIAAHRAIVDHARKHPECKGMGTTCTVLAFRGDEAWLAHIGDSRAYLLRGRTLTQLSEDQTLVAKLVSEGTMTQAEADHSPMHNVILQALGATPEIKPMISGKALKLQSGDVLILCSDGVYNMVSDATIAETASRFAPQEACDSLIEAALAAGGHDNASLGIFSVSAAVERNRPPEATTRRIKIPIEGGHRSAGYADPEARQAINQAAALR